MFAVRRGVIRFILCHETIFALRYSAHANDEAFAKGDKDSNGQCAHSDFHCPTTDVNNLVGSCDQKFNDVTHANRYRKILYSEGELDRTDFSIPPSRSNPYPFDPAAEPTLLPPTHSRSLIPYVNHVPLLQNLVDLGMNLYEVDKETNLGHSLLKLDWNSDICIKLKWLMSIGAPIGALGSYLTRNPFFLVQDLNDMKVRVNYLRSKNFRKMEIVKIVIECRYWINTPVRDTDARLGWIQKTFYLSGSQVRMLVVKEPRIVISGIAALQRMVQILSNEMEFSGDEIRKIILKDPRIFMCDSMVIIRSYTYLHGTMGLSNRTIANFPMALRCSPNSLRPRFEYIKYLKKDLPPLVDLLHPSDRYFACKVAKTFLSSYISYIKQN